MAIDALEVDYFQTNVQRLAEGKTRRVARAAGISRTQFSYIINGHCRPSLDTALWIANALNCPLDLLLWEPKKLVALEKKIRRRDPKWTGWHDGWEAAGSELLAG
jgi:transcriptional regulator with XRE-family HTH domain